MTDQVISVGGVPVTRMELHVPNIGAWVADLRLAGEASLSGRVTITWGDLSLVGTIVESTSGTFVHASTYRIVGGAGGWGRVLTRRDYHADNGVSPKTVATDAATEVGESLASFTPGSGKFAASYIRRVCQASRVLEDCAFGVPWWVGLDGQTYVGQRPATTPDPEKYHLLDFDPTSETVSIGLEDAQGVTIGSTITDDRLDRALTVRELRIVSEGDRLECSAWCGSDASGRSRLGKTFQNLVKRSSDAKIYCKVRYRVLTMADDGRVNLQVVNTSGGFPDALLVPQSPGAGGIHVEYSPGAIVLVEFIEGSPDMPRICGAENWDASNLARDSRSYPVEIQLGGPGAQSPIAINGSLVQNGSLGQTITFSTLAGVPLNLMLGSTPMSGPYLVSFGSTPPTPVTMQPLYGAVMSGSKTAKAGPP